MPLPPCLPLCPFICPPSWSPFWAALGCRCRLVSQARLPSWSPFWAALGCRCRLVPLHLSSNLVSPLCCRCRLVSQACSLEMLSGVYAGIIFCMLFARWKMSWSSGRKRLWECFQCYPRAIAQLLAICWPIWFTWLLDLQGSFKGSFSPVCQFLGYQADSFHMDFLHVANFDNFFNQKIREDSHGFSVSEPVRHVAPCLRTSIATMHTH